ncbi:MULTISPECIES: GNAT family N-acetyltransferase [Pseudoalteromonas]|uniref:GNAT family N-acetyltransferase n=1 Tax=Pseudoalteromonas amylolytica TaxID=1859457 RepID=A0A1S1MPK4_9GAMM|nr:MULTISPECIES: GNAT family N-acetyltransferase [Pseudoalteromonas]OHU84968.1 GNAT family N-acetyltransferase [Pseudoalteromonas sp. JW3]OHU90081.1 GNAT family N-acetyltransferase [Pseudoalteromonas amylolytica]
MEFKIRKAKHSDIAQISALIEESARKLACEKYSKAQIEGALKNAWGVDSQLIIDCTYFVVECGQILVACGGWSYRKTLFGSDKEQNRSAEVLNPEFDAAKIRAFFVKPDFARKGIASMIMSACESEVKARGFRALELMATLPGIPLYKRHGFVTGGEITYPLDNGESIQFVPMRKKLVSNSID